MGAIKRLVKLYRVGWLLVGFSACLPASRFLKSTKDFLPSTYTRAAQANGSSRDATLGYRRVASRSEEHTSELQSRFDLVCRLLLEKKKCVSCHFCINLNYITLL